MEHQSIIPTDLVLEILSWTPLQTLTRCRLVSKEWNNLIYQSYFMHLHSQRTRTVSGFFIAISSMYWYNRNYVTEFLSYDDPNNNLLSLNFLPGSPRILASTNQGYLLCLNTTPKHRQIPEYYVCKPTTKEWRQIPNPKTRYFTRTIAMMVLRSHPLRYKIIRLSEPNRKHAKVYSQLCEVFDSERWAWNQLPDIYLPYGEILLNRAAISVCGVFHWLTSTNNIFALHSDDETWTMLSVPGVINASSYNYFRLAVCQGKLALFCSERERDYFDLWVIEDYFGKKQWNKKQNRVSMKPLQISERFVSPKALYNAEIVLMRGVDNLFFYNIDDGSFNVSFNVVRLKSGDEFDEIFSFQSDLEPSNMRE